MSRFLAPSLLATTDRWWIPWLFHELDAAQHGVLMWVLTHKRVTEDESFREAAFLVLKKTTGLEEMYLKAG